MNPFETSSIFNSQLYESVNKLNKNSEKLIIQGLNDLINIDDPSISLNNIMIKNSLIKHFNSSNTEIRNLSSDLLLKIINSDSKNLTDVLSVWLIKFIEDHSYKTDKIIYKKFVKLENLISKIYKVLDWKEDLLLSLKIFTFIVRNSPETLKEENRKYFLSKIEFFKYNSNIVLKYLYVIMDCLGQIEEIYDKIVEIEIPVLITTKWKILCKIYQKIPFCINKDLKFIEIFLLEEILKNKKNVLENNIDNLAENSTNLHINLENYNVKNFEEFKILLNYCDDKLSFYKINLDKINPENFCIFQIVDNFKQIDENFENPNEILKFVLNKHKITNKDLEDALKYIKKFDFIKKINSVDTKMPLCECQNTNMNIFKNLLDSLTYLNDKLKIQRGFLLSLIFNREYFSSEIINKSKYSVHVFDKEDLFDYKNTVDLICKYPEDYTNEEIMNLLNLDNYKQIANIKKFTNTVKKWIKTEQIRDFSNFDCKEFDLMLFCLGVVDAVRFIDYDEICQEYLEYLENISKLEIFNKDEFDEAVVKWLGDYKVPCTLEYNDSYFTDIEYFYENVELKKSQNLEIQFIRKFYRENLVNDFDFIIYRLCNVILNIKEETNNKNRCETKLNLKINNFFLYKVYRDLGINVEEPFSRNKDIEKLIEGEIDEIKGQNDGHVINSKNPKIIDQQILRGLIVEVPTTSYLSDESLEIFVDYLKDNFEKRDFPEYILEDINLENSEKRFNIYEPVLDLMCKKYAESLEETYKFLVLTEGTETEDRSNYLIRDLPHESSQFPNIFIETLMKIRNLNLIFFIEKILTKSQSLSFTYLLNSSYPKYQKKLIFLFPALYRKYSKPTNADIKNATTKENLLIKNIRDLILEETNNIDENIKCSKIIKSSGIRINFKYQVEENDFDCEIFFPPSYPLVSPDFTTNVEKNSLLNLKISKLLSRTSNFVELLKIWRNNVDQKSKGVQECYICYFILHLQDGSFPEFECFHCSHKFHTKCIQKWFYGYKKTNCPLCRKELAFL
ncbi:E3 ubiquitin-protein ligase listerin (LTN1) [Vairimorpha necatrix]|uniref:E3 ubiquitin-protein ligase listerin n=1 Tax=Vairimorpha necatrix TaxID=6039 RepID=A0AAX4JC53_9MICR